MNARTHLVARPAPLGNPPPLRMLWITAAWGSCFVAITIALNSAPALWIAALRALIAGAALALLTGAQRVPIPRDLRTWALVGCLGVVNIALGFATMFGAATGMSTGIASVLTNAQPILILLPAWWLYRERPTPSAIAAGGIGFVGLLVIALPSGLGSAWTLLVPVFGILLSLLFLREGPDLWGWIGTGIVLISMALLAAGSRRRISPAGTASVALLPRNLTEPAAPDPEARSEAQRHPIRPERNHR